MRFESEQDVLNWYESQPRVLTEDFLKNIPWHDVKNHALSPDFVPVLTYMRNVEKLTEVYFDELRKTPTGRHPVIRKFMERWHTEEDLHGDLLQRFMGEAGYPSEDGWFEKIRGEIPKAYRVRKWVTTPVAQIIGSRFSAVHMTWGALQEYSTLSGYQRLWQLARHPVLEHILQAIAKEETMHAYFYWSTAGLQLRRSSFSRKLVRKLIQNFWKPVGQGLRPKQETRGVLKCLFSGIAGAAAIDQKVNRRLRSLPGMQGMDAVNRTISRSIALA